MKSTAGIRRWLRTGLVLLALAAVAPAWAAVKVTAAGRSATAEITFPGGIAADLRLEFDKVRNLSAESLGISARLVSLSDPLLLARLPDPSLTSIPSAFPVLITVEPPAARRLEFENTVSVEVHTHNLVYVPGTRLRLFKAPLGGAFTDITEAVEAGSVRTRGRTGAFSEFLILVDLRASTSVADEKYAGLRKHLANATTLSLADRLELQGYLDASQAHYRAGRHVQAIAQLDAFRGRVSELAGFSIANVWRAGGRLYNIAGELLGVSASLKFTLGVLRDGGY